MNTLTRPQTKSRLEMLAGKWWLYLALLLLFFLPSRAAQPVDPRESVALIGQVLSDPLIYAYPLLMPLAKAIPALLMVAVSIWGNRFRRAFNLYVALLYVALAVFQTTAVTADFGLVLLTGNLALVLVVALFWLWEVFVQKNSFTARPRRWWQWWVVPVAAVAFLAPVDATTMTPDFTLSNLLGNEAGLTTCMMTPVFLAFLTLFYPAVNHAVLRVTSFAGLLLGVVNMIVWFVIQPWGWWMGVMHVPLLLISLYCLLLEGFYAGKPAPAVLAG